MTGDGADARAPGSAVDARQQQGAKICGEVYQAYHDLPSNVWFLFKEGALFSGKTGGLIQENEESVSLDQFKHAIFAYFCQRRTDVGLCRNSIFPPVYVFFYGKKIRRLVVSNVLHAPSLRYDTSCWHTFGLGIGGSSLKNPAMLGSVHSQAIIFHVDEVQVAAGRKSACEWENRSSFMMEYPKV